MSMSEGEKGQGLVEYAMLFILVALLVIFLVFVFGKGVGSLFSNVIEVI
jgi:pilus assembly protein Flp/PilA